MELLNDEKLVLVWQWMGGTICRPTYNLISIKGGAARNVGALGDCSLPEPRVSNDGSAITISFFETYGERVVYQYKDGNLSQSKISLPVRDNRPVIDGMAIEAAGYSYLNPYAERYDLENIIQDSKVNQQLTSLIPQRIAEFKRKLFIYGLGMSGDFIIATGIAPSSGGSDEGFIALSKFSKDIYLAILDTKSVQGYNGDPNYIRTVSIYTNRNETYSRPPEALQSWIDKFERPIVKWNFSAVDPVIPAAENAGEFMLEGGAQEQSESTFASFDCSKASEAIEVLICSDNQLANYDAEVARLYKQKRASHNNNEGFADIKREQKSFLNDRIRLCKIPDDIEFADDSSKASMVSCLKDIYRKRLKSLDGRYKIDFRKWR